MERHKFYAYETHFKLGFHDIPKETSKINTATKADFQPINHSTNISAICFGKDKDDLRSLSSIQFNYKEAIQRNKSAKQIHKNDHTFKFGYDNTSYSKIPETHATIDTAQYINLNKQTNVVLGKDKAIMDTISKTSYIPKKITQNHQKKKKNNDNAMTNCFWSVEKNNNFETSAMDYKGIQGEKAQSKKIPDSKIFSKSLSNSVDYSTGKMKNQIYSEKAIQDPCITKEFIYGQHFSMGNSNEISKNIFGTNYRYSKNVESVPENRKKILGSMIELGLSTNKYNTLYKTFYSKNELDPPLPFRNCLSNVCFGVRKDQQKLSEYDKEYEIKPILASQAPYPKNKIQNINIFRKH